MDELDIASRTSEFLTEIALRNKRPELSFKGCCYNCDEPLEDSNFCDEYCRDDYEKREKFSR